MGSYIKENYVKDKAIIITGASSGFGEATARKASAMGAKVVLAARREDRLKTIVDEIRSAGGEAIHVKTDVRCLEQVESMVEHALGEYGRIDVLINNAGLMPNANYAEHEWAMEAWEESIDTNFKGVLYCTSTVYDQMIKQGRGHVVDISSIMGNYPVRGCGVYNATKVAIRYLAEALRTEARGKIKVTSVRPSYVSETELTGTVISASATMSGTYHKLFEAMAKTPETAPGMRDIDSIQLVEPTAEDLADNIIYVINQPWGVDISDITVRASNENMFL